MVSGVTHLGCKEDLLSMDSKPSSGSWKLWRAEQCLPSLPGNLPDRGKLGHKNGFMSLGCLSLCVVEQGM